jgi:hypothetical protein
MSRLEEINSEFRNKLLPKNDYNNNNKYDVSHPDTLSDGDELGKDEFNGSVGSFTDIKKRTELLVKNIYNSNDMYDSSKA